MKKIEAICDGCGRNCPDNYLTVSVGGDKEYPKRVFCDEKCLYRFAEFKLDKKISVLNSKKLPVIDVRDKGFAFGVLLVGVSIGLIAAYFLLR